MILLRILCSLGVVAGLCHAQGAPKRVSHTEAMSAAVTKVQPEYPNLARQLHIAGAVELEVLIGEGGSVENVTPVSGNPVLTKPAGESLKKWKFKPFTQDGAPVKAVAVMKITFTAN